MAIATLTTAERLDRLENLVAVAEMAVRATGERSRTRLHG